MKGVEAGAKLSFSDLVRGGFFTNFGIDANATYSASSKSDIGLDGEACPSRTTRSIRSI